MMLMPGWAERLEQVEIEPPRDRGRDLPRNPDCFRVKTTFVDTIYGADDLLVLAGQLPLSHIGIDTEFRYDRPGFRLDAKTTIHDVRSVRPLLLSLTLVEVAEERQQLYTFVVDLRLSDVVEAIAPLFQLPVPFVGHYLQVEWFCLWQLGIEPPRQVWDTFIAEKARYLGLDHKSNHQKNNANEIEEIRAKEAAEEAALCRLDLVTSCRRYGIDYRMAANKKRLQQSFLDHALGSPFSAEQIAYAAEDAIAAASLYLPQVMAAAQAGLLNHLLTIEMPWVVTNARMNWTGLRVDAQKGQLAKQAAQTRADALRQALQSMGLANVNSHPQLQSFFEGLGLLQHFARDGKVSFDRERLKANQHLHPAIAMIRDLRKMDEWQKMQLLNSGFVGADGRVHPAYRHLGAATGRQTCNHPNVLALSAVQRNLIIPDEGNGIGEVDLSQIEPGIAGVVYRDSHLIDLFNTGDVYSAMAQQFYADQLDDAARDLSTMEFKAQYGHLRKPMKPCTLGIIYGLTPHGLAGQLKCGEAEAAAMMKRFKALFPELVQNQTRHIARGQLLGFASTATGLKRYRGRAGALSSGERNWMINHPVQGTAAALFKAAGNELDALLQPYGSRLIIALHDSYVFEAPIQHLGKVGELVGETLCRVIQRYFPELRPQVDLNMQFPMCWNKEGACRALDEWIEQVQRS